MASQVPYSGTLQVAPQLQPTPRPSVDAPIGAFGGLVAQATEHLGQVSQQAGNELFTRAIAMQQMNQQASADEASAHYSDWGTDRYLELASKRGKDAVDAFPAFQQDLEQKRQEISAQLGSPYARQLFNQESRNYRNRLMFSGGIHVKDQNQAYVVGGLNARIDAAGNAAAAVPEDDAGSKIALDQVKRLAAEKVGIEKGVSDLSNPIVQQAVLTETSKYLGQRVRAAADKDPFAAKKMLADNKQDILPDEYSRLGEYIQKQENNTGARVGTHHIMGGGDISFGAKIVSPERARAAIKAVEGGNYTAVGPETKSGDRAYGAYQVMGANLPSWLKQAGMVPMSPQQFLASPSAQDQLFDFKFGQVMKNTGSYNEAAKIWFTGTAHPRPGVTDATTTTRGHTVDWYLANSNASLAKTASQQELEDAGKRWAENADPDNPILPDYVVQHLHTQHALEKQNQAEAERQNWDTISNGIEGGFSNNNPPKTIAEALVLPQFKSAYDSLSHPDQLKAQRAIQTYNSARLRVADGEAMTRLIGLTGGDEKDIDAFLKVNPYQEELTQPHMREISDLQRKLAKDRGGDPDIRSALAQTQPLLIASRVDTADRETMAKFRGGFIEAYYDWKRQNPNKFMDRDTVNKIASSLLTPTTSPNFWWGKDSLFNLPLPTDLETKLRTTNPNITDAELEAARQEFVHQEAAKQYQQLQSTGRLSISAQPSRRPQNPLLSNQPAGVPQRFRPGEIQPPSQFEHLRRLSE